MAEKMILQNGMRLLVETMPGMRSIATGVWIGAGSVLLPGVSIGDNSVIGAGSIVTKDIPANVVAVGNPCRVLREIGEHDREFYYRDRRIVRPL